MAVDPGQVTLYPLWDWTTSELDDGMHARNDRPPWTGVYAQRLVRLTLQTYGDVCHLCGGTGATSADHLIARSAGGSDDISNLRPAHLKCNQTRGAAPLGQANVTVLVGTSRQVSEWLAANRTAADVLISDPRIDDALSAAANPAAARVATAARQAAIATAIGTGARVILVPSQAAMRRDPGQWVARGWNVLPLGKTPGNVGGAAPSRVW